MIYSNPYMGSGEQPCEDAAYYFERGYRAEVRAQVERREEERAEERREERRRYEAAQEQYWLECQYEQEQEEPATRTQEAADGE